LPTIGIHSEEQQGEIHLVVRKIIINMHVVAMPQKNMVACGTLVFAIHSVVSQA
jgi:hypothetical protein